MTRQKTWCVMLVDKKGEPLGNEWGAVDAPPPPVGAKVRWGQRQAGGKLPFIRTGVVISVCWYEDLKQIEAIVEIED